MVGWLVLEINKYHMQTRRRFFCVRCLASVREQSAGRATHGVSHTVIKRANNMFAPHVAVIVVVVVGAIACVAVAATDADAPSSSTEEYFKFMRLYLGEAGFRRHACLAEQEKNGWQSDKPVPMSPFTLGVEGSGHHAIEVCRLLFGYGVVVLISLAKGGEVPTMNLLLCCGVGNTAVRLKSLFFCLRFRLPSCRSLVHSFHLGRSFVALALAFAFAAWRVRLVGLLQRVRRCCNAKGKETTLLGSAR